jgi:hypothetical protein
MTPSSIIPRLSMRRFPLHPPGSTGVRWGVPPPTTAAGPLRSGTRGAGRKQVRGWASILRVASSDKETSPGTGRYPESYFLLEGNKSEDKRPSLDLLPTGPRGRRCAAGQPPSEPRRRGPRERIRVTRPRPHASHASGSRHESQTTAQADGNGRARRRSTILGLDRRTQAVVPSRYDAFIVLFLSVPL